ncbi:hypothetical protein QQX98_007224 [Neonectria punicea]|uniref:Aminoglycoside phosphotransferase domain-containing protein n=1 Tax=Neonectria punicea TaxID=979145 RepID=A0ABR1GYU6_9HYPO
MEVAAINLISKETTIPVPRIEAWGTSVQNPLFQGPSIIMEFIQGGASLNDLLKEPKGGTRLLKDDLSGDEIETIYRQFAVFLLQLFKLNFDHIGSLDSPTLELRFPDRPLTWKAHDILQTGGVDVFVCGRFDAMVKYRSLQVLRSLIPDFIYKDYDRSNFKIIYDDLGLANLIVRSRQNLTVIGVVDLEWSYIGPAQLFGSASWWLLMDRPTNLAWDCDNGEPSEVTTRYFRYLGIFLSIPEGEEAKTPGHKDKELSRLVPWSQHSGAMWVHMLLSTGFKDPRTFLVTKLIQHLGVEECDRRKREVGDDKVTAFGSKKMMQLDQNNRDLEKIERGRVFGDDGTTGRDGIISS